MNNNLSLYLPGGGTSTVWQVGFVAVLQEEDYQLNNFVCSSAGSLAGLIYIASESYMSRVVLTQKAIFQIYISLPHQVGLRLVLQARVPYYPDY
jgi:predicted acylesterase/phospholipase RssA